MSRKSLKPSQKHIYLGISTNITTGPLGFRAELDIDPEDKESGEGLQIIFQYNDDENQEFSAPGVSTPGFVLDSTNRGGNPAREDASDIIEGEGEAADVSRDAKGGWTNTARGVGGILFDVAQEALEVFSPLNAVLAVISTIYEKQEERVAVKKKIHDLCSRIATLETIFRTPTNDVAEKERRDGLLCKFKNIGGQLWSLSEKPGLQRFADRAQDEKEVSGLIEDLREAISDYQMVQQMAIYDHMIVHCKTRRGVVPPLQHDATDATCCSGSNAVYRNKLPITKL